MRHGCLRVGWRPGLIHQSKEAGTCLWALGVSPGLEKSDSEPGRLSPGHGLHLPSRRRHVTRNPPWDVLPAVFGVKNSSLGLANVQALSLEQVAGTGETA